jgi:hypothetical protein
MNINELVIIKLLIGLGDIIVKLARKSKESNCYYYKCTYTWIITVNSN